MNTKDMRNRIREFADRADERMLRMINALINADENTIVAYTTDGQALTTAQYRAELAESEREIEQGEVIEQDDIERESEQW